MTSLSRELVFLILQFLDEEKYKETVHKLEKDSGFFFNAKYFEECVMNGEWEEVEKYLSGFTKVDDNRYSMKIFFEIRKQKYLEALDKRDHAKAVQILIKDLKVFSTFNENLFKEITVLLTLQNFRENEQLSKYGDTKSARAMMLVELRKLIEANPLFRDKLQFPTLKNARLRTLINQSLNWQHQLCKNPKGNPEIRTLFVDHTCGQSAPVTNPLMASVPRVGGYPLGAHVPYQTTPAPVATLGGWMSAANSSSAPPQSGSGGPVSLAPPNNAVSILKRPRSPPTISSAIDYQAADSVHVLRRSRPFGISEEVNNLPLNALPISYPGQSHAPSAYSPDDLPTHVVVNLSQGSAVKSMDFNPSHIALLLVGTNIGDVAVWEVSTSERLVHRNFKIWDLGSCSVTLQASLSDEHTASVNRVTWSPDGALCGVAYSKHIIHVFSYHGGNDLRNHLEIDAHVGNVSDIAFSNPTMQLYIITCGEDKSVKVWDIATGAKLYGFEGHDSAVYSVCPHYKENIQFIFSTSVDGKIKAWLYDNMGSRVHYEAPGRSCTTMAYCADGTRLFSCGTNKEGESHLVEWNEIDGTVKRSYSGLGKRSIGVVQFDTAKNRFLAAGDEFVVKIWDMDQKNVIKTIDAEGGLPASPCIRFNKEGTFLAISTSDNGVKILANAEGIRMMRAIESLALDPSRIASSSVAKGPMIGPMIATFAASSSNAGTCINVADRNAPVTAVVALDGDIQSLTELKTRIVEDSEKLKIWKLTEMNDPSQIRSFRLPDNLLAVGIFRLIYTNSGSSILALAYNAVHKLWKWQRNEGNLTGKATTAVLPQLWQPASGIIMTNDISETSVEEAVPCFALSKNDSYVLSASGGKISLFNMMTFKTLTMFMSPPPAATCLAFHPQDNNVIAIGMEDGAIQIYNIRVDQVKSKFKGHQKRVTGLAFSNVLGILVSSGADAQVCVWSTDGWEKKFNKFLQIPPGRESNPQAHTRVQFDQDQTHVLVVHETQIAIYEASTLDFIKQWVPQESSIAITDATYSCDGQSIYASLDDGSVYVLTAEGLKLRCQINVKAYLPSISSVKVHPVAITAHPSEPNQFALGLTDGGVHVLEPLEAEGKWGSVPPTDESSAASTSITPIAAGADQAASI